jgi:hypothetical protein
MSDKHRHHREGVDLYSQGVVSFRDFVEKCTRLKGGSGVLSAPTFPAPMPVACGQLALPERPLVQRRVS